MSRQPQQDAPLPADTPVAPGVTVAASHQAGIFALDKPAGLLAHPNVEEDVERSVIQARYDLEAERFFWSDATGETRQLWLCNRLDGPTSGLLLFASSVALASEVRDCFYHREIHKTYYAVVRGKVYPRAQTWRDRLETHNTGTHVRTRAGAGHYATTQIRTVKDGLASTGLTMLRLSPKTGRTHQLRVQCAHRGHPILGDRTYGDFDLNHRVASIVHDRRLFLHAGGLEFSLDFEGRSIHFSAHSELPGVFGKALKTQSKQSGTKMPNLPPKERFLQKLNESKTTPGMMRREAMKRQHKR